jgi:hypothetical protein
MKIVVFDLDETLGYFTQLGIFWDILKKYLKNKNIHLTQNDFNDLLDLYPEFLRPNIINILNYLKEQKKNKCCHKMMIYTNNNGPKEWANHIIRYFETKLDFNLVDQIIGAFKVNGKIIEICRTCNKKTHNDFIRCSKIPANSEICFLDDTFYPEMANENIYYINIKPYYYDLKFDYMINKFKQSNIGKKLLNNTINYDEDYNDKDNDIFEKTMMENIKLYKYFYINKDLREYEIDKVLGKHIINHLKDFFNKKRKNKTFKNRKNNTNTNNNKSRKNLFF